MSWRLLLKFYRAMLGLQSISFRIIIVIPPPHELMAATVFLSHNRADKPFARRVAADLQRAGADVWLDEEQIDLGSSIQESIQRAIDASDFLAVVLSPDSVASKWVRQELRQALDREINADRVVVLPLMYRTCDVPGFLRDKLYADFQDSSAYETSLNLLKKRLGLQLTDRGPESEWSSIVLDHEIAQRFLNIRFLLDSLSSEDNTNQKAIEALSAQTQAVFRIFRQEALLKSFARGSYAPSLTEVDLATAVRKVLDNYSDNYRDVESTLSDDHDIPSVFVDRELTNIAIYSLVDNAFKYADNHTTVGVDLRTANGCVRVAIANKGDAAKGESTHDLFAPGHRGKESFKYFVGGRGLGLYLAKLIAAAHGGEIEYSYNDNSATNTFSLIIPLTER